MTAPRVLTIAHNHPDLHPGGAEILARDLAGALRGAGSPSLFLACVNRAHREPRPGTAFQALGPSPDEMLLWAGRFDLFHQSQLDLDGLVPDLADLLTGFAPDVVHVHHTLLLGAEMLFLVRRTLPRARIVFTLHDYLPICPNDGQMVTTAGALCEAARPDACAACLKDRTAEEVVRRERHLKTLLGLVDVFVAPSRFLRDRFVAWGLPADRIVVIPNARPAADPAPHRPAAADGRRNAFAFFGNLTPYKGADVLLDAAARLAADGHDFTLEVHGGAAFQDPALADALAAKAAATGGRATLHGAYRTEAHRALMARADWVVVPSVWWENAPLVIQEAFRHRRPVICSGIGGMAEAVRDGVDGLHARPGDAADLARVLRRAMETPGLWDRLAAAVPTVPDMADAVAAHRAVYRMDAPARSLAG
jgi:glycosyltransferase involved in cell wall biosynthesis